MQDSNQPDVIATVRVVYAGRNRLGEIYAQAQGERAAAPYRPSTYETMLAEEMAQEVECLLRGQV